MNNFCSTNLHGMRLLNASRLTEVTRSRIQAKSFLKIHGRIKKWRLSFYGEKLFRVKAILVKTNELVLSTERRLKKRQAKKTQIRCFAVIWGNKMKF